MAMSRAGNNVWTLRLARRKFISRAEKRSWTYVADEIGSVNGRYIGQVLDDGYPELPEEETQKYEALERVKLCRLVVGKNERKIRCRL